MGDLVNNQASTEEVSIFLENAKKLVAAGKYDFVPRRKNMQALARHGFLIADAKEKILELIFGDYYKGPKQDFNGTGEIWEFKKNVDGIPFYIKIKIVKENGEDILKCLGFHEDDFVSSMEGSDEKIL